MTTTDRVGFAGLSHLGIIYSMAAAARGFQVLAFDERSETVADLAAGRFPVSEPGLEDAYRESRQRIRYSAEAAELAECLLIFLTLDVQTDDANSSYLTALENLISSVTTVASDDAVIVVMSQVPPGFCRALLPRVKKCKLYYQVETLVFGNAVDRAVNPERFMVGCGNSGEPLPVNYRTFLEAFRCPILPMVYESAELCKIAINCFLVSSVSTTNTLAELCENVGADWSELIPALRLDKRIGQYSYLTPGLGIAGGNLERDLVTVQRLAAEHGCDARVVASWQQNSAYRRDWVLRRLFDLGLLEKPEETVLAIWGLAYKQDTHSTKNSPSLALLRSVSGYRCQAYDPAAKIGYGQFPSVRVCATVLDATRGAHALVVMTPWKEFAAVAPQSVAGIMSGSQVLDPYGVLDGRAYRKAGFDYHRLGA